MTTKRPNQNDVGSGCVKMSCDGMWMTKTTWGFHPPHVGHQCSFGSLMPKKEGQWTGKSSPHGHGGGTPVNPTYPVGHPSSIHETSMVVDSCCDYDSTSGYGCSIETVNESGIGHVNLQTERRTTGQYLSPQSRGGGGGTGKRG